MFDRRVLNPQDCKGPTAIYQALKKANIDYNLVEYKIRAELFKATFKGILDNFVSFVKYQMETYYDHVPNLQDH